MDANTVTRLARKTALIPVAAVLLATSLLAGCKGFWDPPTSTTTTGTTASTTTLAASSTSVAAGSSVTLTATVAPAAATGTVTFYAGSTSIGTGTLSAGTATYAATFATAGTESVTATYGGNSTYATSTSSATSITVTSAAAAVLAGSVHAASATRTMNLVLAPAEPWTASGTVHLHNLAGVAASGSNVSNIDGGSCVLYSGTIYFADGTQARSGVYALAEGGYLAPEEEASDLRCE